MDQEFLLTRSQSPDGMVQQAAPSNDITILCYENEVPPFVATEIDRLYGHLGCSLSNFKVVKELQGASTYVVRKGGAAVTVLLFRRARHKVTVISEFIKLDQAAVQLFADTMFSKFRSVSLVSFDNIQTELCSLAYPYQRMNSTDDIVVALPLTVNEYQVSLGKNMRRNIKRYSNGLQQDFPSYRYQVYVEDQVSEQDIRAIIKLNWSRMASKNIVSRIDEEETQWIVRLAHQCGIVGVTTINGQVCGGAIGFRIGNNYFMHVIAHEPAFNDYSLGILCYYHTICEGIVRGGKRFHLLSGRYEYKYRLLGATVDIERIDIYRSRAQAIMYGGRITKTFFTNYARRAKLWMLEAERRDDRAARLVTSLNVSQTANAAPVCLHRTSSTAIGMSRAM